ncbi:MAG: phosphate ABC transporter permease subunit PstC [Candidatus Limnocylindrales bacterium]
MTEAAHTPEQPGGNALANLRRRGWNGDLTFRAILAALTLVITAVLAFMMVSSFVTASPVYQKFGIIGFVTGSTWAPSFTVYGAWAFIYGTLLTSIIALVIAVPISMLIALLLAELAPARLRAPIGIAVDLLAAVPSVVYGLWGLLVLVPALRPIEQGIAATLGRAIPFFGPPTPGPSYFVAGVILAVMTVPIVTAVTREVFSSTPRIQREAVLALGGTRWDVARTVTIPIGRAGLLAAVVLGLGRAIGETIAVTLVIGNSDNIGKSIFAPGFTLASVIANEFNEATETLHPEALIALGTVLLVISVLINAAAIAIRNRFAGGSRRGF